MTLNKISRKQKILDAALHCFNEYGIEASTIDMIREQCGASVGSIYHHFGNKEALGVALYMHAMTDYHTGLQQRLHLAKNAEEGVKAITSSYVDWIVQNPEQARFVLYNRGYLSKNATTEALDLQTKSNGNLLRDWFKPNIKNGNIKSLPPECYPSLLLGPAHDYARLWLSGRTRKTLKEFREIFIDAAWNAVRPFSGG